MKWCERRDSNSHGLPHWILNPARLPIPPLSLRILYNRTINSETFLGERFTCPDTFPGHSVGARAEHHAFLSPPGTNGHASSIIAVFFNCGRKLQTGGFRSGLRIAVVIIQRENQRSGSCRQLRRRIGGVLRQRRSVNERGGNYQGR